MPDYEFQGKDKVVQQMSRDGLEEQNLSTGGSKVVSSHTAQQHFHSDRTIETGYDSEAQKDYYQDNSSKNQYSGSVNQRHIEEESQQSRPYQRYVNSTVGNLYANNKESEEKLEADKESGVKGKSKKKHRYATEGDAEEEKLNKDKLKTQKKLKSFDEKIAASESKLRYRVEHLPSRSQLMRNGKLLDKQYIKSGKVFGRLKFDETPVTNKEYNKIKPLKELRSREQASGKALLALSRGVYKKMYEDVGDIEGDAIRKAASGYRFGRRIHKRSLKNITNYTNPYARLKRTEEKLQYQRLKKDEYEYKKMTPEQKKLQKQMHKRKYKKAAVYKEMQETQQRYVRHRKFITKVKDAVVRIFRAVKTLITMIISSLGVIIFIIMLLLAVFLAITFFLGVGGKAIIESTYQADYNQISDCSAYMRELETDLEERISLLEEEEYPDCYEYIYELGEIGHNSIELLSYLAAKFLSLDFATCKAEIEYLFGEMYHLTIEVREEIRYRPATDAYGNILYDVHGNIIQEAFLANICYVILEVTPLSEIIADRLTPEEKETYDLYMMPEGGQQVYNNCLNQDWGTLISSKFGNRIHPVTGEKTFHNGIDIAVPTGTDLYSSTTGTVTTAAYSDTAGYYIIVTSESGWSVKYMHLDSMGVSVGQTVLKGQLIGQTGNTGRSTGPHLHLEVRDANNNPVDPTFIVPSKSALNE